MDNTEARSILSAYRADESYAGDARFEEARKLTEVEPALARWWQEEQELDRLIGLKLEGVAVPAGLRECLLNPEPPVTVPFRPTWPRKIALLAASIVLLAVFFGSWQGLFQPATSLADYRDEMVSFVRLDPTLDLKASQLSRLTAFLEESGAPSDLNIPPRLQQMDAAGCRKLRFRGRDVALICFKRDDNGELVHLFVVNRKAVAKLRATKADPHFTGQGEWMTATWVDGEHAYLFTAKGSRDTVEKFLGTS
ncbi:MAG: hypothetical protein H0W04_01330 [Chthoniobacterales bacterium]|nr:hypothetical protein [Chthoniobacterales bacterium]